LTSDSGYDSSIGGSMLLLSGGGGSDRGGGFISNISLVIRSYVDSGSVAIASADTGTTGLDDVRHIDSLLRDAH